MPVVPARAFENIPTGVLCAVVPPNAWLSIDGAHGCPDARGVDVGTKLPGSDASIAPRVLRFWLGRATMRRVPVHRQPTLCRSHPAITVLPAVVQGIQLDEAAVLADGHDPLSRRQGGDARPGQPEACVHEEHITTGLAVLLRAACLALVLKTTAMAVWHASGEGNGIAKTVVALRHWNEVLHGVKTKRVSVAHLVEELVGSWDDGPGLAQEGAIHVDEERIPAPIAVNLQALAQTHTRRVRDGHAQVAVRCRVLEGQA
mmetsp:Transcript_66947/g.189916  ORF Transcript_66947/g.189916 Transcript_66947/m.189916 type:complete len:259 (+) Transcript_66947:2557-3333(+)